ncbi:MAG: multicopper oxidase domain-containing protein [Chloroflexota bacterium]|nr:multicopper oxidase domain-containing protein [Chloroflexota bacterium]
MREKLLNRRALVRLGASTGAVAGAAAALPFLLPAGQAAPLQETPPQPASGASREDGLAEGTHPQEGHGLSGAVGDVDTVRMGFDPSAFARRFDYGEATTMRDGTVVREWNIAAYDKEIEIAPGVFFPAWTYNGQVPGPTLRANEGELLRVHFVNAGTHPHTIHFHGIHSAFHDGVTGIGRGDIQPGDEFTYEFTAKPYGCHLYHCHTAPLKRHIHKGLYGGFIVNPDPETRGELARARHPDYPESEEWQEFIMVMNAFDTTFDAGNEVYAANSVAFHYMRHPIEIDRSRPVRIYLINITEFDPINSLHLHANFFNYYDTGTTLEPTLRTVDTIMQAQGQRGILEFHYKEHEPGLYMFHAHVSEFAELGWMSLFDVR